MSQPTTAFSNQSAVQNQAGTQHVQGNIYHGSVHNVSSSLGQERPWSRGNVHWVVNRPVNTFFTGRKKILEDIEKLLHTSLAQDQPVEPCRIVISGMGGQGKSEICLRVAHSMREHFWGVFWVDVSSADLAKAGFMNISKQLNQPAKTIEEVLYLLSNAKYPWLLVVDNADDVNYDYQQYLPAGQRGCLLMTTRNEECGQLATTKHERLARLDDEDAELLLFKAAGIHQDEHAIYRTHASATSALLGSHALALIQAGSYVAQRHCTLAEYAQVFGRQCQRLMRHHPRQAQSRYQNVYATFEVSAEVLESSLYEDAKDALDLLTIFSVLGGSPLPLCVFKAACQAQNHARDLFSTEHVSRIDLISWHADKLPDLIKADHMESDFFRLTRAVCLLQSLGLLSVHPQDDGDLIAMHPLAHAWARERQTLERRQQSWIATACTVLFSHGDRILWLRQQRKLQPHLFTLLEWTMSDMFAYQPQPMVARIYMKAAHVLHWMKANEGLGRLLYDLLSFLEIDLSSTSVEWLELYEFVGSCFSQAGRHNDAISLLQGVLIIPEGTLPSENPSRLQAQRNLAFVYLHNRQYEEAISLFESLADVEARMLPADHPGRLDTHYGLAEAHTGLGNVKKAISLFEEVVKIDERAQHPENSDVLSKQMALARAYGHDGQIDKAIRTFEGVLETQRKFLDIDHPDRLSCLLEFAHLRVKYIHVKQSTVTSKEVIEVQNRDLPMGNRSLTGNQNTLEVDLTKSEQLSGVTAMIEEVVNAQRRTLPPEDSNRILNQMMLAQAYLYSDQPSKAMAMVKKVLEINGEIEEDTLYVARFMLGRLQYVLGQYGEAVSTFEQITETQGRARLGRYQAIFFLEYWLAKAYLHNAQTSNARSTMERAMQIMQNIEGIPSEIMQDGYRVLTICLLVDKRFPKVQEILRRSVQTFETKDVPARPQLVQWGAILVVCEEFLARFELSQELFKRFLAESGLGPLPMPKTSSVAIGMSPWRRYNFIDCWNRQRSQVEVISSYTDGDDGSDDMDVD